MEPIKFITKFLTIARQHMYEPNKVKKDKNLIKVKVNPTYEKNKQVNQGKMTPEELQNEFKANRGTGAHKNVKDKRSSNPFKKDWE